MLVFGNKQAQTSSNGNRLFEAPLEQVSNGQAIKQLAELIGRQQEEQIRRASGPAELLAGHKQLNQTPLAGSLSTWAKLSRENNASKRRRAAARMRRRFTLDSNELAKDDSSSSGQFDNEIVPNFTSNQVKNSSQDNQSQAHQDEADRCLRKRLVLECLPSPIKCLLEQLYLRGPSTVGIFRKSPNAKHCKELRNALERLPKSSSGQSSSGCSNSSLDGKQQQQQDNEKAKQEEEEANKLRKSVEQYQVNVIASVFKEWLRSLPDSLLTERLFGQWIDVAKLIEQHQASSTSEFDFEFENKLMQSMMKKKKKKSFEQSPLTDSSSRPKLARALSCFRVDNSDSSPTTTTTTATCCSASIPTGCLDDADGTTTSGRMNNNNNNKLAWCERRFECLRIVRQLLEMLPEANLVLLKALVCVLWHIASQSDHNKMSPQNLGVCVAQSLLRAPATSSGSTTTTATASSTTTFPAGGQLKSPRSKSQMMINQSHLLNERALSQLVQSSPIGQRLAAARRARSHCHLLSGSTLSLASSSSMAQATQLDPEQESAKYVPILLAFMIEEASRLFGPDVLDLFGPQRPLPVTSDQDQSALIREEKGAQQHGGKNLSTLVHVGSNQALSSPSSCECSCDSTDGTSILIVQAHPSPRRLVPTSTTTTTTTVDSSNKRTNQQQDKPQRPLSVAGSSTGSSSSTSGVHSAESPEVFSADCSASEQRSCSQSSHSAASSSSFSSSLVGAPSSPTNSSQCVSPVSSDEQNRHLLSSSSSSCQIEVTRQQLSSLGVATLHVREATSGPEPAPRKQMMMMQNNDNNSSSSSMMMMRAPKVACQYTTSNYGGEAVLYSRRFEQQQQQQYYSLNVMQQQQQQQPPRSHVMMLRNYYLSLQCQNQENQNNLRRQQQQQPVRQTPFPVSSSLANLPSQFAHNKPMSQQLVQSAVQVAAARPRLAKIRQNPAHFQAASQNHLFIKAQNSATMKAVEAKQLARQQLVRASSSAHLSPVHTSASSCSSSADECEEWMESTMV